MLHREQYGNEVKYMKIAIAGTGYVGLSNAILLAQHHEVYAVDLIAEKVAMINEGKSPLVDAEIEEYLAKGGLILRGLIDFGLVFGEVDTSKYNMLKVHYKDTWGF